MDNERKTERLSPKADEGKDEIGSLLDEASDVARRVLGAVQKIAGTAYCKGVQINELHKYAVEHSCWICDKNDLGVFTDRGSENEVYLSDDNIYVYKLNDFRYADDNLSSFFDRIAIHNRLFPECSYTLVGFAENNDNKCCAVLRQPFIHSEREATDEEIILALTKMGFESKMDCEYFTNGIYDIFDAVPNNVLLGKDGKLYFIDTIIYYSDERNNDIYRSLSPKYNK